MSGNGWLNHVKRFQKRNANMSYREVLKQARKTYNGGGEGVIGDSRSLISKYASALTGGTGSDVDPTIFKETGPVGVAKGDLFQKYSELSKSGGKRSKSRKSLKTRKVVKKGSGTRRRRS